MQNQASTVLMSGTSQGLGSEFNKTAMPFYWVYILLCHNSYLYVGYTKDLVKRYQLHLQGKGAKFTRSFPPIELAQVWPIYGEKRQAMQIERYIKGMTKIQKQSVVNNPILLIDRYITVLSDRD